MESSTTARGGSTFETAPDVSDNAADARDLVQRVEPFPVTGPRRPASLTQEFARRMALPAAMFLLLVVSGCGAVAPPPTPEAPAKSEPPAPSVEELCPMWLPGDVSADDPDAPLVRALQGGTLDRVMHESDALLASLRADLALRWEELPSDASRSDQAEWLRATVERWTFRDRNLLQVGADRFLPVDWWLAAVASRLLLDGQDEEARRWLLSHDAPWSTGPQVDRCLMLADYRLGRLPEAPHARGYDVRDPAWVRLFGAPAAPDVFNGASPSRLDSRP